MKNRYLSKISILLGIFFFYSGCTSQNNDLVETDMGGSYSGQIASNLTFYSPPKTTMNPYATEDAQNIEKITSSFSLSRAEVSTGVAALEEALKNTYIGYYVKPSINKISMAEIFSNCKKMIASGPENFTPQNYYDLFLRCIAQFEDSHFSLGRLPRANQILTVITSVVEIDGKYYIASIRPKLLEKLESLAKVSEGAFSKLVEPGSEILEIDQRPVLKSVEELYPYVSASSPLYRFNFALKNLFVRSFAFPNKNSTRLKIKSRSGAVSEVDVPWIVNSNTADESSDISAYADKNKITSSMSLSSEDGFLKSSPAYVFNKPLFQHPAMQKYANNTEGVVLQTLLPQAPEVPVCYLKLDSFSFLNINGSSGLVARGLRGNSIPATIENIFSEFLDSCEKEKAPLVLDLRFNSGGNTSAAFEIIAYLSQKTSTPVYWAMAPILTKGNFGNFNMLLSKTVVDDIERRAFSTAFLAAQKQGSMLGPWVVQHTEPEHRGKFTKKIVVLTSPDCMSSCEILAGALQKIGRGTVVGKPTSGTGFGSIGSSGSFKDPFNMVALDVSNFAFQYLQLPSSTKVQTEGKKSFGVLPFDQLRILENSPVLPKKPHERSYTLEDLDSNLRDFKDFVLKVAFE